MPGATQDNTYLTSGRDNCSKSNVSYAMICDKSCVALIQLSWQPMTVCFGEHAGSMCIQQAIQQLHAAHLHLSCLTVAAGYTTVACCSLTSVLPDCGIISRVGAVLHGASAALDGDATLLLTVWP